MFGLRELFSPVLGFIVALVLILGTARPGTSAASADPSAPYLFGVVPQFSAAHIVSIWRPLLNALEKETGLRFRLAGSDSIPAFEKEFSSGRFDFVYMNPYHFVHAERSQGYRPLVRDVGRMLFGIIVVRKDSPIESVLDLHDKVVAFPAPNALGASLIPRAELLHRYNIQIRPRYVRSHSSVYLNVALGKTDAGGGVQKTLEQQPHHLRDALRVVHSTMKVVPHPVAAHPRVPMEIREQVKAALLSLGMSTRGRGLLSRIPIKTIGTASSDEYRSLLELGLESLYEE